MSDNHELQRYSLRSEPTMRAELKRISPSLPETYMSYFLGFANRQTDVDSLLTLINIGRMNIDPASEPKLEQLVPALVADETVLSTILALEAGEVAEEEASASDSPQI
jgi:hypothetical protein